MRNSSRISEIFRDCQLYLQHRVVSSQAGKAFKDTSKRVREYLEKNGTPDDDGNLVYLFPGALVASDDKAYDGVMLRRLQGKVFFDTEEVMRFVDSKGISERQVIVWHPAVDEDGLMYLYQDGKITEDELRGLMHYPEPTYALWPIEHKEELEE